MASSVMSSRPPAANGWKRELPPSPLHAVFAALIQRLPSERFPDCDDLNGLRGSEHRNSAGRPICFVAAPPPASRPLPPVRDDYEERIFHSGEILTRAGNWHDLFNALAWLALPHTKRELNQAHRKHRLHEDMATRGRVRDALTLFDESGVIIASADVSLTQLFRDFQWKALFWKRREDVLRLMRFVVSGHALHEQMLAAYPGITGKALVLECDEAFLQLPLSRQLSQLDERTADLIAGGSVGSSRALAPLPLLGIPGWDTANAQSSYYDNTAVFRPGRRARQPS